MRYFVVADNCIKDKIGHFFEYNKGVINEAKKTDFTTICLTGKFYQKVDSLADKDELIFSHDTNLNRYSPGHSGFDSMAPVVFTQELFKYIDTLDVTEQSHVFIPYITREYLVALFRHLQKNSQKYKQWKFHITIRDNLECPITMKLKSLLRFNFKKFIRPLKLYFRSKSYREHRSSVGVSNGYLLNQLLKLGVDLTCDMLEVKEKFNSKYKIVLKQLPVPIGNFESDRLPAKKGPISVGYIGEARAEKGFCLIPQIINSTRKLIDSCLICFIICIGDKIRKEIQSTQQQLMRLSELSGVHFDQSKISNERYKELLNNSDIILLLYDPKLYKNRSSQILIETIVCGKIPLVFKNSTMGNYLKDYDFCLIDRLDAIDEKISHIAGNFSACQKKLEGLSSKEKRFNSHSKLFSLLIEG